MKRILPLSVILIGAILRFWDISNSPPWYDESFTLLLAKLPPAGILAATMGDVHPPLYYFIIAAICRLLPWVPSLLAARILSAVLSISSMLVFWYLSGLLPSKNSVFSWGTRVLGLVFMAAAPTFIFYAQESRMYSLLLLLVLGQAVFLHKKQWGWLAATSTIALYTHNYSLFYTGIFWLAGICRSIISPREIYRAGVDGEFNHIRKDILWIAAPAVLYLPWVMVLLGQMKQIEGGYWIQPVNPGMVLGWLLQLIIGPWVPTKVQPVGVMVLVSMLIIVIASGIKNKRFFLLMWTFGPALMAIIVSIVWQPMFLYRALLPSMPALLLLGSDVFLNARGAGRLGRWMLLLPCVLALGWQIGANHVGWVKGWVMWIPSPSYAVPVIHLEETSFIQLSEAWEKNPHYLIDAGCPAIHGQLTNSTRAGMGTKIITPENLPGHYYFVAVLGPESTACHQETYKEIIGKAEPIYYPYHPMGVYGIWEINKK